jgi:fused signal recognition particle receptor
MEFLVFIFIKQKLTKLYDVFASKFSYLLNCSVVDDDLIKELEILLLQADTGVPTTKKIVKSIKEKEDKNQSLRDYMYDLLVGILQKPQQYSFDAPIMLLVGVNGTGKTTSAGKLAYDCKQKGQKTLLVAADTFRAAAVEQLQQWAKKIGVDIVIGKQEQDAASVVYKACEQFLSGGYDRMIVDTAGRLQTKKNLMAELNKIYRVIDKKLSDHKVNTLLTIDSMLGQNSFEQARLFQDSANVNGVILTKMDGTGKGGVIFALADQLNLPIAYLTFGEKIQDIKQFIIYEYVKELIG